MTGATALFFVLGLAALTAGAELLVRGASRLASAFGVSPLVIGLTVVAYGTSTPELAVSVKAGLMGNADIAVANVVGSNTFNVLFILGACALVAPLVVHRQLVRLEVPIMIAVSGLAYGLAWDRRIGVMDGLILFAGVVIYTVWAIRRSRKEALTTREGSPGPAGRERVGRSGVGAVLKSAAFVLGGLVLLVAGSRWLVDGAIAIAQVLGVSDVVIGLTIVAAGTSLPEVATSILATVRGERDIAIGNVVGSNIYNVLCILGVSAIVTPEGLRVSPAMLHVDFPVMLATAAACLPVFFTDWSIARWEGGLFLLMYTAYTSYLILGATHHDALGPFSAVMGWFVVPLVTATLAVLGLRAWRRQGEG